jgi:hypothetical protein
MCATAKICDSMTEYETSFTPTTDRMCATATTCDGSEYETSPLTATTDRVCAVPPCPSCTNSTCRTAFTDALICPVIAGDRIIQGSIATSLVNPALTRAEGYLRIQTNSMLARLDLPSLTYIADYLSIFNNILTRIDFASLSFIGDSFRIQGNSQLTFYGLPSLTYIGDSFGTYNNPSLTVAFLPLLSQVQNKIEVCQNHASFMVPHGLTSVQLKDQIQCQIQQGSDACLPLVACT